MTADDGSGSASEEGGVGEMMVTGGMAVMLLVLLTLTGFKISLEDIKKVSERRGLVSCLAVLGVQFVAGPVMVACFSALLQMKSDWVVGLMVFSCTPPTVAAPVIAFMVGADVALALSAAIFTLGCSIVLTPLCFAGAAAGGRTAYLLPVPHQKRLIICQDRLWTHTPGGTDNGGFFPRRRDGSLQRPRGRGARRRQHAAEAPDPADRRHDVRADALLRDWRDC